MNTKLLLLFIASTFFAWISTDGSFGKYLDKFNNRYSLGKEITSFDDLPYNNPNSNLIDTSFLLKYKLVNAEFGTGSPHFDDIRFRHLIGYQCEHVGHYKIRNGLLLVSKSVQSSAGNGNPILTLTSIDSDGKLVDYIRFNWEFEQDEGLELKTAFGISPDFEIKHDDLRIDYKYQNGKWVKSKTTTVSTVYFLTGDGHFKHKAKI